MSANFTIWLSRRKSALCLGVAVGVALLVAVSPFVISAQTKVVPSIKLVVLEDEPAHVSREKIEAALKEYSNSQGFHAANFSGGVHLIYYFRPPELSLLTYCGDELISVALWKDHGDTKKYEREVQALREIFAPLGLKDVTP